MNDHKITGGTYPKRVTKIAFPMLLTCIACGLLAAKTFADQNEPPVILNFAVGVYGSKILVSGTVSDPDSVVDGMTVDIGGDVSGTALVYPSGNFMMAFDIPFPGSIYATGQTEDPEGNESEIVFDYSE